MIASWACPVLVYFVDENVLAQRRKDAREERESGRERDSEESVGPLQRDVLGRERSRDPRRE
jgi:hypothetical protein